MKQVPFGEVYRGYLFFVRRSVADGATTILLFVYGIDKVLSSNIPGYFRFVSFKKNEAEIPWYWTNRYFLR